MKEAVGKFNDVPSIDFDTEGRPDIPLYDPSNTDVHRPEVKTNPQYNPFNDPRNRKADTQQHWEDLYQVARHETTQQPGLFDEPDDIDTPDDIIAEKSPSHYQYKGRLIMTAVKSGLMIIDQHRAHLRILFEEYQEKMRNHRWRSQGMLFPEIIKLSLADGEVMRQILPDLADLGFSLNDLGGGFSTPSPSVWQGERPSRKDRCCRTTRWRIWSTGSSLVPMSISRPMASQSCAFCSRTRLTDCLDNGLKSHFFHEI